MRKILTTSLGIGLLLICWQFIAWWIHQPLLFPYLPQLFSTLGKLLITPAFYESVGITIIRGLTGLLLSGIAALGVSILLSRYKFLYELLAPLLSFMRSIPVISFILLALIFLHPEMIPLLIAFLTMFPLLTENLTKGLLQLNPGLSQMGKLFRIQPVNRFTQILYPQLKPFLYSGVSSALGFGWRAIIMGEVLSQCRLGIGSEMKKAQLFIEIPQLVAWTLVAVIISMVFDKIIQRINSYQVPILFSKNNLSELTAGPKVIKMEQLTFSYGHESVIRNFTQSFEPGTIYGISAPSGQGKTTLLYLFTGILKPGQGELIKPKNLPVAMVFQQPELLSHLTVTENILLPLASLMDKEEAMIKVKEVCELTEITALADRYPDQLSFGQQQRVAIARALAFPVPWLLMDEPFKGLDPELTRRIMELIRTLHRTNRQTILFTSHNPAELTYLADKVITFS